ADIESLDATVHELERVKTVEEYIRLDRLFHLRTYSRAPLPQLLAMVERFWNSTQHFRRQFIEQILGKNGLPFSDPQHIVLMDAIRSRDPEAARSIIHLHIRRTRLLIQTIDPGGRRLGGVPPARRRRRVLGV